MRVCVCSCASVREYFAMYIEQEVDGETLQVMVTCATMEQLQACGLKSIKLQMKFRKLASPQPAVDCGSPTSSFGSSGSSVSGTPTRGLGNKLSQKAIKSLTSERKRLYLMR